MRLSFCGSFGLFVLFAGVGLPAGTAAAGPLPEARAGNVLFEMPQGWKRNDDQRGYTSLIPPEVPSGAICELRLLESEPMEGTLEDFFKARVERLKEQYTVEKVEQVTKAKHKAGCNIMLGLLTAKSAKGTSFTWLLHVAQTKDTAEILYFVATTPELYAQHLATVQTFVDRMRYASLVVLADGEPPLTQLAANQFTDFIEWIMDMPFTAEQRQTLDGMLLSIWKKGDKQGMESVADLQTIRRNANKLEPAQRELGRQRAQSRLVEMWRQDSQDPGSQILLSIYESGHKAIVDGDPPLTRQTSDATLEVLYFMASQVLGGEAASPTTEIKDGWAKLLAESYPKLAKEQRQSLAKMPVTCAALRAGWPEASDKDKERLRKEWGAIDTVKLVASAITKAREEAAKSGERDYAKAMHDAQNRHNNYMAMSNMLSSMHQANMACIYNMGGTPWTYRYRP